MSETTLYQLTETSRYMMGFVIVTKEDNVIVIDGGRPADMPLLKEYIGKRHISAWILTHAHDDHISGIVAGGNEKRLEKRFQRDRYALLDVSYRGIIAKK